LLDFLLGAILISSFSCSSEEPVAMEDELEDCFFENQIPVSVIHERFDLNAIYGFFSCYHIPLSVRLSDTTTCIYPFNKTPDLSSSGFYFFGLTDSTVDRQFGAQILDPVWSPDGNWLMWSNNENIFKMPFRVDSLDYTQVINLTNDSALLVEPLWSPQQQKVLFKSLFGPENSNYVREGYYTVNQNGSGSQFLLEGPDEAAWINEAEIMFFRQNQLSRYNLFNKELRDFFTIPPEYEFIRNIQFNPSKTKLYFLARLGSEEIVRLYSLTLDTQEINQEVAAEVLEYDFLSDNELILVVIEDRISQVGSYNSLSGLFSILYNYEVIN